MKIADMVGYQMAESGMTQNELIDYYIELDKDLEEDEE